MRFSVNRGLGGKWVETGRDLLGFILFFGGAQTSHLFAVSSLRAVAGIGPLTRQAAASGETEPLAWAGWSSDRL